MRKQSRIPTLISGCLLDASLVLVELTQTFPFGESHEYLCTERWIAQISSHNKVPLQVIKFSPKQEFTEIGVVVEINIIKAYSIRFEKLG